ncbi:helix-turn-helix domain-containing protein [Hyphobacterium sp.]|uniref:helix-turn-helix domain-containing protein n=1 Tax=Hyphobacterium sp. TaxID=2004662 RepID=UPI0037481E11
MDTPPAYAFQPVNGHDVIAGVWQLESGPGEDRIAPDTRCEIIFHLAEPPQEKAGDAWVRQPSHMIYGPLTRVLELRRTSPMRLAAIRLRPEGIGAIAPDPRHLRNRSRDLADLLPAPAIATLAGAARRPLADFAKTACETLPFRTPESRATGRVRTAIDRLEQDPAIRPSALARVANISIRTLDRDFMRCTGLTPGEFLQITRYHLARQAIRNGAGSLSDIAVDAGYADQAHMTRDFRRFAGRTPRLKRGEDASDIFYEAG